MKPKGNGLVELRDDNTKERGFFCIQLVKFLNEQAELGTPEYAKLWEEGFSAAKAGVCKYREKCHIYQRTAKKGIQQKLEFEL